MFQLLADHNQGARTKLLFLRIQLIPHQVHRLLHLRLLFGENQGLLMRRLHSDNVVYQHSVDSTAVGLLFVVGEVDCSLQEVLLQVDVFEQLRAPNRLCSDVCNGLHSLQLAARN